MQHYINDKNVRRQNYSINVKSGVEENWFDTPFQVMKCLHNAVIRRVIFVLSVQSIESRTLMQLLGIYN